MRRLLLLFLFLSPELAAAARATEWSLHIDTKAEAVYFAQEYGEDTNNDQYKLELDPIYDWRYKESFRFFLKPVFVADPGNKSEEERYFFDATEAFVRYQGDTFSLQAGNSLFSWGVTDGYNPLDVINSKQYFDPLHSRKLGALSLVFSQGLEHWDYDIVYIPRNRGAILPGEKSRWLPREVLVPETPGNDLVLLLPPSLRYHYGSRDELENALDNNFAFRLQRRGDIFDHSLSYFEGTASFPFVQPVVTGTVVEVSPKTVVQVDPDVTLNLNDYRIRQGGLAFVAHKWDFLFKYATSYSQSLGDDRRLPGWTHESVLALEKTFNLGSDGMVVAVLQHSFINSERENDSNLSVTEIFRRAWMIGGKGTWKEVWNFSLMGLYDSVRYSHFAEVSLGRRFFDAWLVTATGNVIDGPSDAPLGVYGKNDSYSLAISRSF